jgi:hypothetical protein
MRLPRVRFTVRKLMVVAGVAAVALASFRWVLTEVMWPREYTAVGNTIISTPWMRSRSPVATPGSSSSPSRNEFLRALAVSYS